MHKITRYEAFSIFSTLRQLRPLCFSFVFASSLNILLILHCSKFHAIKKTYLKIQNHLNHTLHRLSFKVNDISIDIKYFYLYLSISNEIVLRSRSYDPKRKLK